MHSQEYHRLPGRQIVLAMGFMLAASTSAMATPVNFDFQSYAVKSGSTGNRSELDAVPAGLAFSANGGLIGTAFSGDGLEVVATGQNAATDVKLTDEERKALEERVAADAKLTEEERKAADAKLSDEERKEIAARAAAEGGTVEIKPLGDKEGEGPFAYLSDKPAGLGVCGSLDEKGQCADGASAVGGDKWASEILTLTFSSEVFLLKALFSDAEGKRLEDGKYLLNGQTRSFNDGDFTVLDAASVWTLQAIDTAFYLDALSVGTTDKAVPEPATTGLLGLGLLGLAGAVRCRRSGGPVRRLST